MNEKELAAHVAQCNLRGQENKVREAKSEMDRGYEKLRAEFERAYAKLKSDYEWSMIELDRYRAYAENAKELAEKGFET